MNPIHEAIKLFIQGGDNNDTQLLTDVLHPDFQNVQDGLFEENGIFVFTKAQYIDLVETKKFGGNPRNIDFISMEQMGNIAFAKVALESRYLKFISMIICVCENGTWKIINNTPKIEVKME